MEIKANKTETGEKKKKRERERERQRERETEQDLKDNRRQRSINQKEIRKNPKKIEGK